MKLTENFNLSEFSKTATIFDHNLFLNISELANALQKARDLLGEAIIINSGHRTIEHNKEVGGSKNSQHLLGKAADVRFKKGSKKSLKELYNVLYELMNTGVIPMGGLVLYSSFVHYDTRGYFAFWKTGVPQPKPPLGVSVYNITKPETEQDIIIPKPEEKDNNLIIGITVLSTIIITSLFLSQKHKHQTNGKF